MTFSAEKLLTAATDQLGINFAALIAQCAIFPHPEVVAMLSQKSPGGVWFPGYRRSRPAQGEPKRGRFGDEHLDDNTMANLAIKEAVFASSRAGCSGFATCHIWPGTCYDAACHTALANLVLLPAPLAGMTDHNLAIADLLQSRSFALYGWLPSGASTPPGAPDLAWHPFIAPSVQVMRRVARKTAA